jgi:hypothetical protein
MPVLSALSSCPNRHGNKALGLSGPPAHRETAAGPMAFCFDENKKAPRDFRGA